LFFMMHQVNPVYVFVNSNFAFSSVNVYNLIHGKTIHGFHWRQGARACKKSSRGDSALRETAAIQSDSLCPRGLDKDSRNHGAGSKTGASVRGNYMARRLVTLILLLCVFSLLGCKSSWYYREVMRKTCPQCCEKAHMEAKICPTCKSPFPPEEK
jgi:hypothetical protein